VGKGRFLFIRRAILPISGEQKFSHDAEPANGFAAIASVNPATASTSQSYNYVVGNGTLDTLFSDTVDLPFFQEYRGIFVSVPGNIKFAGWDGAPVGPIAVPIGIFPFRIRRVYATGTTVTSLVGLR
jgi:hypothetical protein